MGMPLRALAFSNPGLAFNNSLGLTVPLVQNVPLAKSSVKSQSKNVPPTGNLPGLPLVTIRAHLSHSPQTWLSVFSLGLISLLVCGTTICLPGL